MYSDPSSLGATSTTAPGSSRGSTVSAPWWIRPCVPARGCYQLVGTMEKRAGRGGRISAPRSGCRIRPQSCDQTARIQGAGEDVRINPRIRQIERKYLPDLEHDPRLACSIDSCCWPATQWHPWPEDGVGEFIHFWLTRLARTRVNGTHTD